MKASFETRHHLVGSRVDEIRHFRVTGELGIERVHSPTVVVGLGVSLVVEQRPVVLRQHIQRGCRVVAVQVGDLGKQILKCMRDLSGLYLG
jgi:hypothetical protein